MNKEVEIKLPPQFTMHEVAVAIIRRFGNENSLVIAKTLTSKVESIQIATEKILEART